MSKGRILILEPDRASQNSLRELLAMLPYEYRFFEDAGSAMEATVAYQPAIAILANASLNSTDRINQHLIRYFASHKMAVILKKPQITHQARTWSLWMAEPVVHEIALPIIVDLFQRIVDNAFRAWLAWQMPPGYLLIYEPNEEFLYPLHEDLKLRGKYSIITATKEDEVLYLCERFLVAVLLLEDRWSQPFAQRLHGKTIETEFCPMASSTPNPYTGIVIPRHDEYNRRLDIEGVHSQIVQLFEKSCRRKLEPIFTAWKAEQ